MILFFRGGFQELWITLSSDEPLGLLDTAFLEDWAGQDGQVSLFHILTGKRVPVLMAPSPGGSRANFVGKVALSALSLGVYSIQGRVRDLAGNVTVLGSYHALGGSERILHLDFELADGPVVIPVVRAGPVVLLGGAQIPTSLPFTVNSQGERECSKALSVSGFPSRQGVTLPVRMP